LLEAAAMNRLRSGSTLSALLCCVALASCGKGGVGQECSMGEDCASGMCLTLNANQQGKKGICTSACDSNADQCASDQTCMATQQGGLCLQSCRDHSDCSDGFVCIRDVNTSLTVCLVN
jgi:hypothetical protein